MTNLKERFSIELTDLVNTGIRLSNAMQRQIVGDTKYKAAVVTRLGEQKGEKFLNSMPKFNEEYENWYSQSVAVINQVLPDRLSHLVSFYEKPKGRKSIEYGNYTIQDFLINLTVTRPFGQRIGGPVGGLPAV